ncbi:bcl-2-modifying factor isoform X4 [Pseudopipra pipra]|uniref:bcl-2-modifying factor isoform X4 n=1 Tax=Pseudopipra pipra TaxID=415032 RepID=UPI003139E35A
MDRPSYLEEDYSSLDGLDDDVFHSDDFGLAGNAGYRLHVPPAGFGLDPHLQEEPQESQQEARAEVQIARKLQCIADQFHRLHIQRVSLFQDLPSWLVLAGPCCCCAQQWVTSSAPLSARCPSAQDLNLQLRMQEHGEGVNS